MEKGKSDMLIDALLKRELESLKISNTFKHETELESPQSGRVVVKGKELIMLSSNNYLGMANHPVVRKAAIDGIKKYGYGVASVRFLTGTQRIHRELEHKISKFLHTEDTILFSSSFAANVAFFQALTNEKLGFDSYKDVLYSDRLNHASIIDGQRLCRAETTDRKIYAHCSIDDLKRQLEEDKGKGYRFRIIATDGVFSMEGDMAPLPQLIELAQEYNALLYIDDAHGIGVCGETGRGTAEHFGVLGKVDVIVGTLGKAIGGATGGFISGSRVLIEYLRQKGRPYIFSNSLPPAVVCGSLAAFDLLLRDRSLITRLHENTAYFRREIKNLGFTILDGSHPIIPIMLGEASLAQEMSKRLQRAGVFIKGLWYPVVPKGEARLRAQISASLTKKDIDVALDVFEHVGKKMKII
ncbi:MAG: glycine C-acetyltransferase [Bacteroidetes bacterium]|nr:glycine C-acetyltransferase [Bacteroidota bacterium]